MIPIRRGARGFSRGSLAKEMRKTEKGQKYGGEQREERIRQIVAAAAALYDAQGYDAVTFSKIGREVDFSRINLYNYFRCKEDIFLLILQEDIGRMVEDARGSFTSPAESLDVFAAAWGAFLLRHQRMLALFSIVNTIILRGASDEAHEAFRAGIYRNFRQLSESVRIALPWMDETLSTAFVDFENSYAMTLYPASIEYKEAQHITIFSHAGYGTRRFLPQYVAYLKVILRGLQA